MSEAEIERFASFLELQRCLRDLVQLEKEQRARDIAWDNGKKSSDSALKAGGRQVKHLRKVLLELVFSEGGNDRNEEAWVVMLLELAFDECNKLRSEERKQLRNANEVNVDENQHVLSGARMLNGLLDNINLELHLRNVGFELVLNNMGL